MDQQTNEQGKTLALVSYIWLFGIVIAYFLNNDKKNPFVYFHVRQSLGLWLLLWASGLIVSNLDNFMLSIALWIFFGVLFIYAFVTASSGKAYPVPLVGAFFQKIFARLGN